MQRRGIIYKSPARERINGQKGTIMQSFETTMKRITFTLTGGAQQASASILPDLPQIGDTLDGLAVLEVSPYPLTWTEQKDPEIWNYAIWYLHLEGKRFVYVAVHEEESEKL
jgi:hypothetical protein